MDKKLYDKRKKPDCKKEQQRKEIFSTYSELCPQKPQDNRLSGLETGNKKTGKSGRIYDKILVWNIPPRITCPGVSDWCSTHCYNADARKDVYTIDRWCENLWDFHFRLPELKDKIENQINETTGRCAVRLHSSGDFFSEEYIDFWKEIILEFPKVSFWGYTRTWNVPCLKDNVNELMNLNNMQLFASYDTTMATSVPAIPKSLVFDTKENLFEYTIIANTKGDGEKSGEDFWVKAERLLYCALIGYIYYEAPEEEQNFSTLLEFINASEAREDDEEFKNPVDELFEDLEKAKPEHFAVRQYKKYKLAAGKTAKSILISCGARLAPFDIKELRDLMAYDEMELDMLGDQRTAMFVIISDTDDTFNFVVSILYTQLFNLLCDKADDEHGGRLPYHVRLLLDEFANIGQIPKFDKLIATIRSREISASIILQSQSQLKTIYKDAAETIIGNCDTMLFLGGKESSTLKEISETLGKETIDLYNTSDTRGQSPSFGTTYQKTGKELMSRDELSVMDGSKCILQLRGVRPFLSDKFDITKHKRYKELSDFDKKNAFDVERYLKHELRLRMDEEFDCYEVDVSEESTA